jgi:septum formation protein
MLVLASTSEYRRQLLARLRIPFDVARPDVDEAPHPGEPPADLAARLAAAKGQAIARRSPQAWVIGADQVAEIDGAVLGKPGSFERAADQLAAARRAARSAGGSPGCGASSTSGRATSKGMRRRANSSRR